jgi:hypothetical protein
MGEGEIKRFIPPSPRSSPKNPFFLIPSPLMGEELKGEGEMPGRTREGFLNEGH